MPKQTPTKQVLFASTLRHPVSRVFAVVLTLLVVVTASPVSPKGLLRHFLPPQPVATAATTSTLNFQARLQNAAGAIVADGTYNIEFNLYTASSGGSSLWTEDYLNSATQGVTVKNGYVTVNLGSITAFPNTINWDQNLYLGMTVRGTGSCTFGTCTPADAEMTPRLQLTASAYAFKANQLAQYDSGTTFTSSLKLAATTTGGNQVFQVQDQGAAGTYNLLTQTQSDSRYIQNQNASAQTTSNYWISGTGKANLFNSVTGYQFNGTAGSTVTCTGGNVLQNAVLQGGIITGGTCVANGGGIAPTLNDAYTNSGASPIINLTATGHGILVRDASTTVGGNLFAVQDNTGGTSYLAVTTAGVAVSGTLTATTVNANAIQTNGTQRIDSTGNLANIGTISSGAITSTSTVQGTRLISTIATGTAPLTVTSTTVVANLNADTLDGINSTSFLQAEADTLATVTGRGATTATASSFTGGATIRGLTVDTATGTQDRILIQGAAVGAARFDGTITNADLTAARTWTLQDNSGVVALGTAANTLFFTTTGATNVTLPTSGTLLTAEADTLATVTGRGATTATASSFTGGATIRGLTVDTATGTQDRIILQGAAVGAARFDGTITNADLTAARTWTLPDASGTFITTGNLSGITAVGTVASGTWNGTAVGVAYGGTGLTSYTTGDLLYASGSSTLSKLADVGTGSCLVSGGVGVAPSWGSCSASVGANINLSNLSAVNVGTTALNSTSNNLNLTTTTSGNIVLNSAGTVELQDNTNVTGTLIASSTIQGTQLISTVATGTAPLTVASTTKVTNLNADLLDGMDSSAFATTSSLGNYVQLQGATPGSAQTGNINVSGTILAGTQIGVGVSSSLAALLHVQSNTDISTTVLALETGVHGGTRIDIAGTSNNESSFSMKVYRAGVYTERLRVGIDGNLSLQPSSGYVGIGTATPGQILDVQGGNINTSGSLMTAGTVRISAAGILQNVTTDGSIITSGTVANARLVNAGALTVTAGNGLTGGGSAALGGSTTLNVGAGTCISVGATTVNVVNACADAATLGGLSSGNYIQNTTSAQSANFNITGNGTIGGNLQVGANLNLGAMAQKFQVNAGSLGGTAGNELKIATLGGNSSNQDGLTVSLYRVSTGADWTTASVVLGRNVDASTRAGAFLTLGNGSKLVGINTLSPASTLDVQGDINASSNYLIGGTIAIEQAGSYLRFNQNNQFSNGIWLGSSALRAGFGGVYLGSSGSDGQIAFLTATDNTRRITLAGNTGAITATGSGSFGGGLTVTGDYGSSSGNITLSNGSLTVSNSTVYGLTVSAGSSLLTGFTQRLDSSGNLVNINSISAPANTALTISGGQSGGSDIIHNASDYQFKINGVVGLVGGNGSAGVCISNTGRIRQATSACVNASSIAYKKNVMDMGDTLGILGQLRPVSFDWKDTTKHTAENGGAHDFGLIAQEVDTVLPTLVGHDDDGTIIGLNYAGFVPFLIKGIQQQQGEIGNLQGSYASLNTQTSSNSTSLSQQQSQISGIQNTLGTINGQLSTGSFNNISAGGNLSVSGTATISTLTVTGSTTLQGTLLARDAEFDGVLTINGHIVTAGNAPLIAVGEALGSGTANQANTDPLAVVDGTDNAGTVSLTTGSNGYGNGVLAHISFAQAYNSSYKAVISASNDNATDLRVYIVKTLTGFDIVTKDTPQAGMNYQFDYIVLGAQQVASN